MENSCLDRIRVVLVRPQNPENVGSVARVMMNMGLGQLVLVSPRHSPLLSQSLTHAWQAAQILEQSKVVGSLDEALVECHQVYGISRKQRTVKMNRLSPSEAAESITKISTDQTIALLFGCESDGLSNQEISHVQAVIDIPSSEQFPSLNLSHAVMVVAYEIFKRSIDFNLNEEQPLPATRHHLEKVLMVLNDWLLENDFMEKSNADQLYNTLRTFLYRRTPQLKELYAIEQAIKHIKHR